MGRPRRNWTREEDGLLRGAVDQALADNQPLLWRELAKSVPGRSNKDCRRRWWNNLAEGMSKGPWSEDEDKRLVDAIEKYGTRWSKVAEAVHSRNSNQCSSHWSQVLDPSINHCDWTAEEDEQLLCGVLLYGTNWITIASSHVPKRTTLALKNRYSTLRARHNSSSSSSRSSTCLAALNRDKELQSNEDCDDTRAESDEDEGYDEGDDEDDEDDGEDDEELPDATFMAHVNGTRSAPNNPCTEAVNNSGHKTETVPHKWADFNNPNMLMMQNSLHNGAINPCAEYWTNNTQYPPTHRNSFSSHEAPGFGAEAFDTTGYDPGGMDTGLVHPVYEGEAMEVTFPQGPQLLEPAAMSASLSPKSYSVERERRQSNNVSHSGTGKETYDPCVLSCQGIADMDHSSTDAFTSSDVSASERYQVKIDMLCTTSQLNNLLGTVTRAGTCVRMKIDPQT